MKFIRTLSLLLLSVNSLNAQVSVLAKVDHLIPDGIDTVGNINLTVSGSTAPYTYTWNPGAANTKDVTNIAVGSYSLNVLSASAQTYTNVYSLGYKVLWTNLSNAYYRNDSLVSTQPASNLFGTACSKNTLLPNTDGWFEYVFDNLNGLNYYVCFTDSLSPNSNRAYDLDYGIYFSGGSSDYINYWENGSTGYLATPKIGDVVKVERVGDVIKYLVNNVLKRSTTVSGISQKRLKLKANLQYNTNRLVNVGCSFANTDNISFINYVLATPLIKHNSGIGINDGSISITPKIAGTYSYTWQPGGANTSSITSLSDGIYTLTIKDDLNNQSTYKYNIGYKAQWTNLDRATFRNDSLFSNSTSTGINANASSKNTLVANTDGWFEYVVSSSLSNYYTIGFTDSIAPITGLASDIDYGIYYAGNTGYINSYQNGTTVSLQIANVGDLVRVERIGNTVNYKINGVLFRTVTVSGISQKNWKLKASLQATRLVDIGCSSSKQDSITFQNYVKVIPTVKHNTGPGINDGSLSLKLKNGISSSYTWTPGSVNSSSITSLANGIYSVIAQDSLSNKSYYKYEVGYKVQWTNLNRCYVNSDTLRSTSGINYIYSNAVSKNTLLPNTDGWFEYLFQSNYYYYIGFTDSISPGPSFSDIDYGIYFFQQVGSLQYYENGTQANIYVNPNLGDRIRIERVGNTIYYKINGVVVRSVTNSSISQKTFKIKANLAGVTGNTNRLVDVGCSFSKRDTIAFSNYVEVQPVIRHASSVGVNDASIQLTPRLSGTHSYTWQTSNVTSNSVTALSNGTYSVTIADGQLNKSIYNYNVGYKTLWKDFNQYCFSRNDSLISTGPSTNNFGYACSKNVLNANTDGWFEYVIQDPVNPFYIGLIDNAANNPLISNDINYGFNYGYNNGYWWFSYIESGTTAQFYIPYRKGDVLRIERIGNTINYRVNGILLRTVTNANIGPKVFKLKAISYYQNKLVNVGCSFTPLSASVIKEHAVYDSPSSALAAIVPGGGKKPYTISWVELTGNETLKTNLSPGIYHALVRDSLNDTLTVPVYLGLKNNWRFQKNISVNDDTYTSTLPDSAATLVSYNTIPSGINGWTELTIANYNQNSAFGFLGFASNEIDADYSVPLVKDQSLTDKLKYADSLLYNRFSGGQSNLSAAYNYLHLVSFKDGIVKIGFKGYTSTQVITYKVGDVFRMQRESELIKLYQNNTLIASENFSSYNQQLLNSVFVLSGSSALRSIGGLTSTQGFDYARRPYYVCINEPNLNWVCSRSFDENEIIKSESKEYMDMLGRTIQSQTKLFSENNVLVSEPLYDGYGRAVGQTLPAPSFNSNICYVPDFVEAATDQPYTHRYFDNPIGVAAPGSSAIDGYNAPGDINHPVAVDEDTQGKLGWYYSENNNIEPLVASDDYPYVRSEFYNDPTGRVKRSSGVGQNHYMGSNHETKFIYTSTPISTADPSTNELNYVFPYRTYELEKDFTVKPQLIGNLTHNLQLFKTISINPDGKDQITYSNSSGQTIATCITGDGSNCVVHDDIKQLFVPGFKKTLETIYIPKNKANTFKLYEKSLAGETYTNVIPALIDAQTGYVLIIGTDFTYDDATGLITFLGTYENRSLHLQLGYSFVNSNYTPTHPISASVQVDYSQWTLYFYDRKGRLLGNAAPNDVTCLTLPYLAQRTSGQGETPVTCDTDKSVVSINFNDETRGAANKDIYLEVSHSVDTIFQMNFTNSNLVFQTLAEKRIEDSLYFVANPPLAYNDSTIILISDSAGVNNGYLDSTAAVYYNKIDSINRYLPQYALLGKKLICKGNYTAYAELNNGSFVKLPMDSIPFEFDVEMQTQDTTTGGVVCRIGPDDDGSWKEAHPPIMLDGIPAGTKAISLRPEIKVILYGSDMHDDMYDQCAGDVFLDNSDLIDVNTLSGVIHPQVVLTALTTEGTPIPVKLANKYYWDEIDRLMASVSEDEGRVDYVYDQKEDKLLFTQNDKQRANGGKFNCIVYDKLGRAIITGEYDPNNGGPTSGGTPYKFQNYDEYYLNPVSVPTGYISIGTAALANTTEVYHDGHIFEKTFIEYDNADAQLPIDIANTNYKQKFTGAKVSKTYNDNTTTWYSYDELGRQKWSVSHSTALGYKTINYAYDFRGKLLQSIYQEGKTDNMYHTFSYDADERLKMAKWGRYIVGDGLYLNEMANYSYYLHGPLKRTVLGGNLQGLDYVYTIGGMLKSINNPMSNATNQDPGLDGYATGPNANVSADVFSLMLQYYNNDYVRNSSVIKSYVYNSNFEPNNISYSGLIKNTTWHTKLPTGATDNYSNNPLMYEYDYNELYQLTGAQFGTVLPTTGVNANFTSLPEYKLQNLSYDKNGNMQSLKRYAAPNGSGSAHLLDDLTYNYSTTLKNRLLKVGDVSTNTGGYTAEFNLPNQTDNNNYVYNEIGELIQNKQEDQGFEYNASGLTTRVYKLSNGNNIATFSYNDKGLRYSKITYATGMIPVAIQATYYSYDAGGMLLATYTKDLLLEEAPIVTKELSLYAAGRMGVFNVASNKALYELSDHLGNTRAVVAKNGTTGLAETISYTDYYPHGGTLPGRNYVNSLGVPYAYQGIEKDAETNLLNFELRQYDARLGRWYNPDPMGQHNSPYLSMGNNPISMTDPNGGWDIFPGFDAIMGFINTWGFGTNLGEVNVYGEDLSGGGPKALQAVCATCGEEQMEINAKFNNLGAEYANFIKSASNGNWWEQAIGHDKEFDNSFRNIVKNQGDVAYALTGVSSGVRDGVVGTVEFFVSDMWKGETWRNMAATAYNTSPIGMFSEDGQALMKGIAVKAVSADLYDWGNFGGQAAVAVFGAKGTGAFKGAKVAEKISATSEISVLSVSDVLRIKNAAKRINKPITVVGSRAKGTAGAFSDWDYVIQGLNNKGWNKIKNSLPGSKSIIDNTPRNIDIFKGPVRINEPHITIYPN